MRAVTAQQMRRLEEQAVSRGISLETLMDHASRAVADEARRRAHREHVLILAGPGNNGMDGILAARLLAVDAPVSVCTVGRATADPYTGPLTRAEEDSDLQGLRGELARSAVVVDALLGIGASRPLAGLLARVVDTVNQERSPETAIIAVDVPTGVNADTGAVPGPAISADVTVSMGMAKLGCLLRPGSAHCGELQVADVGIPEELMAGAAVTVPGNEDIARLLPARRDDSNKGTFGRVLCIAGSLEFTGACGLSSLAAYRAGAGLVEIATVRPVRDAIAAQELEAIFALLPEEDGRISPAGLPRLRELVSKADSVVVGPGLGSSDATRRLITGLLEVFQDSDSRRVVIDADGLNQLARIDRWWETPLPFVLTPHPGEMSRLTGMSIPDIQNDRVAVAEHHARQWGKVVVLKGSGTVVAAPDGRISVNPTGGPNLATAGTGDVLSGTIGGLLAQGMEPFEAAVTGVYLHGLAGDILSREHGNAGTLAGDLLPVLPRARRSVLQSLEESV